MKTILAKISSIILAILSIRILIVSNQIPSKICALFLTIFFIVFSIQNQILNILKKYSLFTRIYSQYMPQLNTCWHFVFLMLGSIFIGIATYSVDPEPIFLRIFLYSLSIIGFILNLYLISRFFRRK